jgi:hypothetical protein
MNKEEEMIAEKAHLGSMVSHERMELAMRVTLLTASPKNCLCHISLSFFSYQSITRMRTCLKKIKNLFDSRSPAKVLNPKEAVMSAQRGYNGIPSPVASKV